jgi:hypothetical protein
MFDASCKNLLPVFNQNSAFIRLLFFNSPEKSSGLKGTLLRKKLLRLLLQIIDLVQTKVHALAGRLQNTEQQLRILANHENPLLIESSSTYKIVAF